MWGGFSESKENERLSVSLTGYSCAGRLKNLKQLVSAGMRAQAGWPKLQGS